MEVVIALTGAAIGSFLNVCIRRIPAGESLVLPPSHCPRCLHPIKYYDNIPIVSYLLLRGKCRNCRERISLQYPLIELLAALIALLLFWKFGLTLKFLFSFIFACTLTVITFVDFGHQIIPDVVTLPGIPFFFLAAVLAMDVPWLEAALGILIGGGILYAIAFGYELIAKREGMGGGDIKLLAMLGAFIGIKNIVLVFLIGPIVALPFALYMRFVHNDEVIPFGPFLAIAGAWMFLFGEQTWQFVFALY